MLMLQIKSTFLYIFISKEKTRSALQGLALLKPFNPSRCIKASFYIPENRLNFPTTNGFRTKISMKLFYQYMAIFFNV